jgi:hypothetical protein
MERLTHNYSVLLRDYSEYYCHYLARNIFALLVVKSVNVNIKGEVYSKDLTTFGETYH